MSAALLVELTVKVSVALLAACAVTRLMARCSAASRHLVWTLAIVATLLVPAAHVALPRWDVALLPATVSLPPPRLATAVSRESTQSIERMLSEPFSVVRQGAGPAAPAEPGAVPPLQAQLDWTVILPAVWLAGLLFALLRFVAGLVWVARIRRRSSPITDPEWTAYLDTAAMALGITARVKLRRSADTSVPVACGSVAPTVLLPMTADGWSADRRRVVLLHEMAHVARRDCLVQSIAQLARALHWFNPLAYVALARLRGEQERACDDLVLAAGTDAPVYADHLFEIARASSPRSPAWAVLAMARPSQLEGRVTAILDDCRRRRPPTRSVRAAVAASAAAFILAVGALQLTAAGGPAATDGGLAPSAGERAEVTALDARVPDPVPADATGHAVWQHEQGEPSQDPLPPDAVVSAATQFADVVSDFNWDFDFDFDWDFGEWPPVQIFTIPDPDPNPDPIDPRGWMAPPDSNPTPKPRPTVSIAKPVFESRGSAKAQAQSKSQSQSQSPSPPPRVSDETRRRVADALMSALNDENEDVREQALQALAGMRDPRAIPGLIKALRDANADVRVAALSALAQFSTVDAVDAILMALKDQDAEVRERAARHVSGLIGRGLLRDAKYVDVLAALLRDAAPDVRVQAIMALGRLERQEAVPALLPLLKDPNRDIREQAADALGDIADPRAIDALTAALKDPDAEVRQQAARSLGQIARGQRRRILPVPPAPPPVPPTPPRVSIDIDAINEAVARAREAAQRHLEDFERQQEQLQRQQEHIQRHFESLR